GASVEMLAPACEASPAVPNPLSRAHRLLRSSVVNVAESAEIPRSLVASHAAVQPFQLSSNLARPIPPSSALSHTSIDRSALERNHFMATGPPTGDARGLGSFRKDWIDAGAPRRNNQSF